MRKGTPFVIGVAVPVLALGLATVPAGAVRLSRVGKVRSAAAARIEVHPAVIRLGGRATAAVVGIDARRVQVRLVGATDARGALLPWRPLRRLGGSWRVVLRAPALHGVYPVVLRTEAGPHLFGRRQPLLRVFERGTRARPSFDDPVDVVRWWVSDVAHSELVAVKAWPRPAFDRRDYRLHRRFVVAYSLPGYPEVRDRLGIFITAFRDGYHARWRLLEATLEP